MSEKYINRELSWLKFNDRIIMEAIHEPNPLLEQCKFLSIASSNLDEFFMVRVGGLERATEEGKNKKDIAGYTPQKQLALIWKKVREQVQYQYQILNQHILPDLASEGIHFLEFKQLHANQKEWLEEFFLQQIMPTLTPIAVGDNRPFPLLSSKDLHIAFLLNYSSNRSIQRFAIVTIPSKLPRCIELPTGIGTHRYILLENIVISFAHHLFNGHKPSAASPFRLTRNADFIYNDSNANLLILEMQKSLKRRKWGQVVRLEIPANINPELYLILKKYLCVEKDKTILIPGPINITYFMKQLYATEGLDRLRYPEFIPVQNPLFEQESSVFEVIKKHDVFLYHPYDSFDPVVRFIEEAADDPHVIAIKQTLYRVSGKSPIVAALARAARSGKQVTVMIEVRARFDEENNINWCLELEKTGCHVFYGVPRYKTHSKIALIARREGDQMKRYVHLSTGNYNDSTATQYTDMGLFTSDETICHDASLFFNSITGFGDASAMENLYSAPDTLRDKLEELILREIENAKENLPARITLKMNSISDDRLIDLLYKAAKAGVEVECIIRGICCLNRDYSPHIHVRSIVGRYLEHARVFIFENAGSPLVFLSSADWMTRNLDKRVELMFPIKDPSIQRNIIGIIQEQLNDNVKAWVLRKNGFYRREITTKPFFCAQEARIAEAEERRVKKPANG